MKSVKNMDEMDRWVYLRSQALAYRAGTFTLGLWIVYKAYKTLSAGEAFDIIPVLILCLATSVQSFSWLFIRNKMVAGDDEYKESNKFLWAMVLVLVLAVALIGLGSALFLRS